MHILFWGVKFFRKSSSGQKTPLKRATFSDF
nr:MAG TPA: hypothetical protein [Caudoviricetes sp.]